MLFSHQWCKNNNPSCGNNTSKKKNLLIVLEGEPVIQPISMLHLDHFSPLSPCHIIIGPLSLGAGFKAYLLLLLLFFKKKLLLLLFSFMNKLYYIKKKQEWRVKPIYHICMKNMNSKRGDGNSTKTVTKRDLSSKRVDKNINRSKYMWKRTTKKR